MREEKQQPMEQVRELLMAGDIPGALSHLARLHPADQAEVIAALDPELRVPLLPQLPQETLAEILGYLKEEPRRHVVMELEAAVLAPLLDRVDTDVAADVLHMLSPEQAEQVLLAMRTAPEVTGLLRHEDESAGGRMTVDFVALHKEWTVDQALAYLRRTHPDAEHAYYLYVIDADHRLEGVVSLRHLVVAAPDERIADIMTPEVISIRVDEDQEEAARTLQRYNVVALPVVDEQSRLVGVASVDDLMDVAQEEATEDMYRMVGLTEEESVLRPLRQSLLPRLSWLLFYLVIAFFAALTVNAFESTIHEVVALAVFMPMIVGLGGNAGVQTITLVVRSLALGQVEPRQALRVLRRELIMAALNGVVIGLIIGVAAFLWKDNAWLGVVAGLATLLSMSAAVTAGVLVPTVLRLARLDPALASGIIVTAFTDVLGLFFFLGLAALLIERLT